MAETEREPDEELETTDDDEQKRVTRRRSREACDAGLSLVEARLFADSSADISELRKLVKGGCPPDLLRRILL